VDQKVQINLIPEGLVLPALSRVRFLWRMSLHVFYFRLFEIMFTQWLCVRSNELTGTSIKQQSQTEGSEKV